MNDVELPIIDKLAMQVGLAAANAAGATLLFKESKGEKPLYGLLAWTLLLFTTYHTWKAISFIEKRG